MNGPALSEYRARIETQVSELTEKIQGLEENCKPIAPSSALGRLTRMDAISDRGVQEAMLSAARTRLEALQNALLRIDQGNYGTCVRCGREIAEGRLQSVPEAVVCIPCLEKNN